MVNIQLQDDVVLGPFELLAGHEILDSVSPVNEIRPDDPAELYALWEVRGASGADAGATVPRGLPCPARRGSCISPNALGKRVRMSPEQAGAGPAAASSDIIGSVRYAARG